MTAVHTPSNTVLSTASTSLSTILYHWLLSETAGPALLSSAADRVSPTAVLMSPPDLHCTALFTHERDPEFETNFLSQSCDVLTLQTNILDSVKSAISVSLNHTQQQFFQMSDSPHVSLSKGDQDEWKDLGPFVRACQTATDCTPTTDADVLHSASLGAFSSSLPKSVFALRTLHYVGDTSEPQMILDESQLPPELREMPPPLWAKHPYDVGLIKGVEPILITPKSDFRPCQQQYPLRPEAVAGRTPVFKSLLEAGVIVPCNDSPVRTPMLPVKKVRPPPRKDDWRFVQDLQ